MHGLHIFLELSAPVAHVTSLKPSVRNGYIVVVTLSTPLGEREVYGKCYPMISAHRTYVK